MITLINLLILLYVILAIIAIILLINDDRDSDTTLAWIMVIYFVPYLGLPLYYFLGRNWYRSSKRRKVFLRERKKLEAFFEVIQEKYRKERTSFSDKTKGGLISKISNLGVSIYGETRFPATKVEIYPSGALKFRNLKLDLAKAKSYIVLQYFIWEHDQLTKEITEILLEKMKAGVEVYIMYDFVGSLLYSKKELRKLKRAGAIVTVDVMNINMINYRNHRKIAVIDGTVGYTGGINMGQEYIDGGKHYPSWRDDAIRVEGPIVYMLLSQYAFRLYEQRRINLFQEKYFVKMTNEVDADKTMIQYASSSVDSNKESISNIYATAIANSKTRAWLQSPYFVPNPYLYESMKAAARSGVDVRLMITGWPDKKIVWNAAFSYFKDLIKAGVKIYLYEAGFLHAKMATFDQEFFSMGTCNLDTRSLSLHDELTLLVYDAGLTAINDQIYKDDLTKCRQITLTELEKISRLQHFRNSIARLFSKVI